MDNGCLKANLSDCGIGASNYGTICTNGSYISNGLTFNGAFDGVSHSIGYREENKMDDSIKKIKEKVKDRYTCHTILGFGISLSDNVFCRSTGKEYIGFDDDFNLKSYPSYMCIDIPGYFIYKDINEIKKGDIIYEGIETLKVKSIEGNTITGITYKGEKKEITLVKDSIFNTCGTLVLLNVAEISKEGGINDAILLSLMKDNNDKSILPFLLMSKSKEIDDKMNPILLSLIGKDDLLEKIITMKVMSGDTDFSFEGLFGKKKESKAKKK